MNSHFPKVSWLPNNCIAIETLLVYFFHDILGFILATGVYFLHCDMRNISSPCIFFSKRPGTTVEVFVELLEEDRGQALRREILKARLGRFGLEIMSSCELAGWKPTCEQQEVISR